MAPHPDLAAEQAFIKEAYARLAEMRAAVTARVEEALASGRGGTPQARTERDVVVRTGLARLEQLDLTGRSLVFGRIDRLAPGGDDGAAAGEAPVETFHIGRLGVLSGSLEPLVVDWRAPIAEPFYRATGRNPMGVVRRRHFATEGEELLGIEDEELSLAGVDATDRDAPSGALLAALARARSGHMRDIVATVQAEQDEVIRAPLPGVLVVQGGPGTGKTAVALHRAAYLLYTYRFPLERQGVLVVGPNQVFLRYINQVLPSLGESGVVLSTVEGLVSGLRARASEPASLSRLKGDARMARLLAKAVRDRQRPLRRPLEVGFGATTLRLTPDESARIVRAARSARGAHNARRGLVERLVLAHLAGQVRADQAPSSGLPPVADGDLRAELRSDAAVLAALDRMWPRLTGEELVHDLFGAVPLLRLAGAGLFSSSELAALERPRSADAEAIPWTAADLALVDEARALLGPPRGGGPEPDAVRTYGHILVDEVQELTPMQLRVLARRSLAGSMTLVGDLAQATGPAAPTSWSDLTRHLGVAAPLRLVELGVNYRTPAPLLSLAAAVLEEAAPGLVAPVSLRGDGDVPDVRKVDPAELVAEVTGAATALREELGAGTVGVVCPAALQPRIAEALGDAARSDSPLEAPIAVLPVGIVKGLEFDAVVVVEPTALVEEGEGLRALYVALTRATRSLTVVHAQPLPPALARAVATPVDA